MASFYSHVESVTNSADISLTATVECRRVEIREDASVASWPTVDYKITGNVTGSEQVHKVAGETTVFQRSPHEPPYRVNEFICKIRTASGTSDFSILEFGR
jgi:hypothetical protein